MCYNFFSEYYKNGRISGRNKNKIKFIKLVANFCYRSKLSWIRASVNFPFKKWHKSELSVAGEAKKKLWKQWKEKFWVSTFFIPNKLIHYIRAVWGTFCVIQMFIAWRCHLISFNARYSGLIYRNLCLLMCCSCWRWCKFLEECLFFIINDIFSFVYDFSITSFCLRNWNDTWWKTSRVSSRLGFFLWSLPC